VLIHAKGVFIKTYDIEDNIYIFGLYGSLFVTFRIQFTLIIIKQMLIVLRSGYCVRVCRYVYIWIVASASQDNINQAQCLIEYN
jgi:hypothetical protein